MKSLPKSLASRPFTYQQALKKGLNQYALNCLLEQGTIERVARGVYQNIGEDLSDEVLFCRATKLVGSQSAICLLSALSYYQLTDLIPKQIWLMVPDSKRTTSTSVKLFRTRRPKWNTGIEKHCGYNITSLERTIVDSLTNKSVISKRVGLDALKLAVKEKKTSLNKIIKISIALEVKHLIFPYIEALS